MTGTGSAVLPCHPGRCLRCWPWSGLWLVVLVLWVLLT